MNDPQSLQVGDIVRHHIYGEGAVHQVKPSSGGMQYFVMFSSFPARPRWLYGDGLKVIKSGAMRTVKAGAES